VRNATGVPQRVLIVGGNSEIGASLARAWLRKGTREFVITERVAGRSADLVRELDREGAETTMVLLDATDPASIEPAIEEAWSEADVDVTVVAIGLLGSQRDIEAEPSQAWDVLTVNATASIQIGLEVANRLERQQHGTLVLLSSVAGQRGRRDNYVYGASKAALDTFAEGLQQRFAGSEIGVLVVRPGYVHSKMSAGVDPAPLAVTVEQSRDQILRALEHNREVVWVPSVLGTIFYLFKLLPRRVWATIVAKTR